MSEYGVRPEATAATPAERRMVPLKIGEATVLVEQVGPEPTIQASEYVPVAELDPREAFEKASEAIKECVRIVGERIENLTEGMKPQEVSVEFSLGFEAKGKAWFPILVQAEATANAALKVTAVWQLGPRKAS
ncbi:MAG: CU044_2847 family protein [Gaiellaceae bacterium]